MTETVKFGRAFLSSAKFSRRNDCRCRVTGHASCRTPVLLSGFLLWPLLFSACSSKPAGIGVDGDSKTPISKPIPDTRRASSEVTSKSSSEQTAPSFWFRDATRDWKLNFRRYDDITGQNRIQETTGGGVALFDFDLDGRLDVFLTQGSRLPRSAKSTDFTNELFRNVGGLENVTVPAGVTSHGFHTGCAVGDFDDDGFPDLYVTAYGRSSLWHNNGDGSFSENSESSKAVVDVWSSSVAFADFNCDGLLDLYVVTYIKANDDPPRICPHPQSPTGTTQCSPTLFQAFDDVLLLNNGDGQFVDLTRESGIDGRDGKGLGIVACDFDDDGQLEVFIANDGTPCFYYDAIENVRDQTAGGLQFSKYEESGAEIGVALNGSGRPTAAMGVAHGDYDRDGWVDLFITNFYLEPNTLFRNLAGRGFIDASASSRLGPPSRMKLAFGTEFCDADHDGWLDLIVANGHVEDRTWAGQEPYKMAPQLFRNDRNGRFTDVATAAGTYFTSEWVGRGLATGDLDRDGDIDVVVSHSQDPSVLLLNETKLVGESVVIRFVGTGRSPRSGIGVRLDATNVTPILRRQLVGGGSFQSASALELHLGMMEASEFEELECRWPDGTSERWTHVKPGYYTAIQGRGLIPISFKSN